MKVPYTQRYNVRFADGSMREACCGPRVLQMLEENGIAYTPVGEPVSGECCHYKMPNNNIDVINKVELAAIQEHLAEMNVRHAA